LGWHWGILAGSGGVAAGAFDLLTTTVLGSNASTVTFSGLGSYSGYKHLQIRWTARSTGTGDNVILRLNGDTTDANYNWHALRGSGSTPVSNASIYFVDAVPQSSAPTGEFGAAIVDLLDFGSTNKFKTIRTLITRPTSIPLVQVTSQLWRSTNAVTSIDITINPAFLAASRFSLYGVK
jgi:hypothetical protein